MSRLVLALLAACYQPNPPQGAPCQSDDQCPSPQHCFSGTCLVHPSDGAFALDAMPDADLACTCADASTLACPSGNIACPAGCTTAGGPRCEIVVPSNSVTALFPPTAIPISIGSTAVFDTDTGAITGAITRAAGMGIAAGIGFQSEGGAAAPLGVFSFSKLDVAAGATVRFQGAAAAVFVVQTDATIEGTIDGSGGCYGLSAQCAGPGGGTGGSFTTPATGCGIGVHGVSDSPTGADSGGGGGGGGQAGAAGGTETASGTPFAGGAGGAACFVTGLEPLVGGSGGGAGGPGDATGSNLGGGGGGALQLTAFDTIHITGTLNFGGAGGMPGTTSATNGGAGCGGGAGGAILLEAPNVVIVSAIVAANGGAGGGASDHTTLGGAGQNGLASAAAAQGGTGANSGGPGGSGGTGALAPTAGGDSTDVNAGGGGGGAGEIYIRSLAQPQVTGTISPVPGAGPLRTM